MSQEEFLLKWNDHHNSFFNIVQDLCAAELLTDVTLACSGQVFETHKIVLCASSAFFRSVLAKQRPDRHPIVFLKDVDPKHLEQLLHYMYQGEITVLHEDLNPLIETARALQVKGLADAPSNNPASSSSTSSTSASGKPASGGLKRPPPASTDNSENNAVVAAAAGAGKLNQAAGATPPPPLKKARNPLLNSVKGNNPGGGGVIGKSPAVPATGSHLANRLLQPKNPHQSGNPLVPQLPPAAAAAAAAANHAASSALPFMSLLPTVPEPLRMKETDPRSWKIDGEDVAGDYDGPDDEDDDDRFNDEEASIEEVSGAHPTHFFVQFLGTKVKTTSVGDLDGAEPRFSAHFTA